jgi:hypothetical protein
MCFSYRFLVENVGGVKRGRRSRDDKNSENNAFSSVVDNRSNHYRYLERKLLGIMEVCCQRSNVESLYHLVTCDHKPLGG